MDIRILLYQIPELSLKKKSGVIPPMLWSNQTCVPWSQMPHLRWLRFVEFCLQLHLAILKFTPSNRNLLRMKELLFVFSEAPVGFFFSSFKLVTI